MITLDITMDFSYHDLDWHRWNWNNYKYKIAIFLSFYSPSITLANASVGMFSNPIPFFFSVSSPLRDLEMELKMSYAKRIFLCWQDYLLVFLFSLKPCRYKWHNDINPCQKSIRLEWYMLAMPTNTNWYLKPCLFFIFFLSKGTLG